MSIKFAENGTVENIQYHNAVPQNSLHHVTESARLLGMMMCSAGARLVSLRGQPNPKPFTVLEGDDARKFHDAVLSRLDGKTKKPDWFFTLFGEEAQNPPLMYEDKEIKFNPAHRNAPKEVIIILGVHKASSSDSEGSIFDKILKIVIAKAVKYPHAIGEIINEAARSIAKRISANTQSCPSEDRFTFADKQIRDVSVGGDLNYVDMHLMNLIPATTIYESDIWKNHHATIRALAKRTKKIRVGDRADCMS